MSITNDYGSYSTYGAVSAGAGLVGALLVVYIIVLIIALAAASMISVFLKRTSFGIFIMLCISAVVFFGVYFGILTIMKEPLVIDIENQLLKKARRNK